MKIMYVENAKFPRRYHHWIVDMPEKIIEHFVDLEIGPYKFRVYFTEKDMAE